jgi:hypothetical protein
LPSGFTITPTAASLNTPLYGSGIYLISNVATGTTSVVVSYSLQYAGSTCEIAELSHIATASPADVVSGMTYISSSTGSATAYTGSVTTTNPTDVIIGVVTLASLQSVTPGTGYTTIGTAQKSGYSYTAYLEFQNVSSTGTYNPGATWSTSSNGEAGTVALKRQ